MKRIKLYEEFLNEANNMRTLKGFLKELRKEYGPTPTEQSLADFIYNNYEEITGDKLEDADPADNDHIADIVAYFKMDGEDFMIAWEDRTNESVINENKYAKVGKLGYNDQFLNRKKSLAKTLSNELGLTKEFTGPFLGFDYVSLYAIGPNKIGGTILDDALTGKYTYEELKDAAVKYLKDKGVKVNESTVNEDATTPKDSKVTVDDYTTDNGLEIKSTEIVGAMVSSESEEEFKEYFYDQYGIDAFTENDMGTLTTYFNEYLEEVNAEEVEAEEEEKDSAEGTEGDDDIDAELAELEAEE